MLQNQRRRSALHNDDPHDLSRDLSRDSQDGEEDFFGGVEGSRGPSFTSQGTGGGGRRPTSDEDMCFSKPGHQVTSQRPSGSSGGLNKWMNMWEAACPGLMP
jgi:hypothetical protein